VLYAYVWEPSGRLPLSACAMRRLNLTLALRRKKLSLQYCLKLSANTNNPAYNAVFSSKFKTQFDRKPSQTRPLGCRRLAESWLQKEECLTYISFLNPTFCADAPLKKLHTHTQSHLGYLNAVLVISVHVAMTTQLSETTDSLSNNKMTMATVVQVSYFL